MLSKSERDAIRAREQAAMKGPWEWDYHHRNSPETTQLVLCDSDGKVICDTLNSDRQEIHEEDGYYFEKGQRLTDMEFLCATRTDIPALLDDLDAKDALLALIVDKLEIAGGTADSALQHQIVHDLQTDIRQGSEDALAYWRDEIAEREAAIAAMRKALERFTVYLPSISRHADDARAYVFPYDAHCPTVGDFRYALTLLQSPDPGKALLDAHAAELAAVGEQLESDRTKVADCLTKANLAIDRRHWLTEGRGSYEWNDDRWHDEFRQAAIEIKDALAPLTKIAADWKDCPQTGESVARARLDLQAEIAALRQRAEAAESERDDARAQHQLYFRKWNEAVFASQEAVKRAEAAERELSKLQNERMPL